MVQSTKSFIDFDIDSFVKEEPDLSPAIKKDVDTPPPSVVEKGMERKCPECGSIDLFHGKSSTICKECGIMIEFCPDCNSGNIYHSGASVICKDCGYVIEDHLPESKHGWRVYTEEDKTKIHAEKVRIDKGMTTEIMPNGKDYLGRKLSPEMNYKMRRLSERDRRAKETKEERVVRLSSNQIRILCGKLRLSDKVKNESILFFKKYVKNILEGNLKGKSIKDLSVTIIYKVCKDLHTPFQIDEIASLMNVPPKKIRSYYSEIMKSVDKEDKVTSTPIDYIPRFSSELKLDGETEAVAYKIIKKVIEHDEFSNVVMGKQMMGYSAAAIYLAGIIKGVKPMRNRDTVARCTNVAESTIKKRAEDIVEMLEIDINYHYNVNYKRYIERHKNRFKKN